MSSKEVLVDRFEADDFKNGGFLSKQRYHFDFVNGALEYTGWHEFHRDELDEKWGHDWPQPERFERWLESCGYDPDISEHPDGCACGCINQKYEYDDYLNSLNPVVQRTTSGKNKMSGAFGYKLWEHHPCPDDVALEALQKFLGTIVVRYKSPVALNGEPIRCA